MLSFPEVVLPEFSNSRYYKDLLGLVLLVLSELSSRAFSQSGNYISRAVLVMMLLTSVSEKQRRNILTDRSGMAQKRGTKICVLIRYILVAWVPVPYWYWVSVPNPTDQLTYEHFMVGYTKYKCWKWTFWLGEALIAGVLGFCSSTSSLQRSHAKMLLRLLF